jgi:hypothetical protein
MALPFMEMLYRGDCSFYSSDDGNAAFNYYLAVQYFRTNKTKKNITGNQLGLPPINLSRIWNVMSHILATNVAMTLYRERQFFKLVLLQNQSSVPFIAGDQPVVNTFGSYKKKTALQHKQLELYYPLGPDVGLLITRRLADFPGKIARLTEKEVGAYNRLIINAADSQVYANQEDVLCSYL